MATPALRRARTPPQTPVRLAPVQKPTWVATTAIDPTARSASRAGRRRGATVEKSLGIVLPEARAAVNLAVTSTDTRDLPSPWIVPVPVHCVERKAVCVALWVLCSL